MAIVVPILLSVTGAATTIAAATGIVGLTSGMVSAVVGLAFQVSGVNDKINKAASKVFGEDLVQIANIAGAAYGVVNGGFEFGSGAENVATAGDMLGKAALDGTASFGANSAANALDLADVATGAGDAIGFAGDTLGKAALDGTDAFGFNSAENSFNLAEASGVGLASDGAGVNIISPEAGTGGDARVFTNASSSAADDLANRSSPLGNGGASDPLASRSSATAQVRQSAAAAKASAPGATSGPVQQPSVTQAPVAPLKDVVAPKAGSFFDKLGSFAQSEKGLGLMVQGVGAGLTNASKERLEKEKMAAADRRYHSVSGIRVA